MPGFNGTSQASGPSNKADNPLRSYRWHIEQLGDIRLGNVTRQAKACTFPGFQIGLERFKSRSALVYKFAESVDWKDVTVTFYDTAEVYRQIDAWYQRIWTPSQGLAPAENYKRDSIFVATNNLGVAQERFTLRNSFPINVDHGNLSYESNEMKILTVTLVYDFALFNNSPSGSDTTSSAPSAANQNQVVTLTR